MKNDRIHLFRAIDVGGQTQDGIPDWIHLLPAGRFSAWDGRGPFMVADAEAVIAASMAKGMLPIDQDHATDLVEKTGAPAPARGWIVEMQARADGIWGRVEWTGQGKALLSDRAYRGISPVIIFDEAKTVLAIRRAALTNDPALDQLSTVFSGNPDMNWKEKLCALLGLPAEASDEEIGAALEKAVNKEPGTATMSAEQGDTIATLTAQVAALTGQVTDLKTESATFAANALRAEATTAIDAAIGEGKPIKPQRDTWIALFAADPEKTKAALAAMPSINGDPFQGDDEKDRKALLSANEAKIAALMGVSTEAFTAARQAEQE